MKRKLLHLALGVGLLALAWVLPSSGDMSSDSYAIPVHVLDNGGTQTTSTHFHHIGALGQPTPTGVSEGTTFRNHGGFIPRLAAHMQPCPDGDEDGYEDCLCAPQPCDCDDIDPLVGPEVEEICDDGIDNDCDGLADYEDDECPIFEAFVTCLTPVVYPGEYSQVKVEIQNITPEQQHFHAYLRLVRCSGVERPWKSGHRTIGPGRWFRTTINTAVPENTPGSYLNCDLGWRLIVNEYPSQDFQDDDACTWRIETLE